MNSLSETIDKILSKSFRDTPVAYANANSFIYSRRGVGINSPSKLMFTSFHKFGAHLQYTVVGANSFTYDLNGNLISDGVYTYTYDYENRLISANKRRWF